MKTVFAVVCLVLACLNPAAAAPPSDASLSQLMALTEMKRMVDGMFAQIDGMMNGFIQQNLKGQTISPPQQKAIDDMKAKMAALVKTEYRWEILEPQYRKIYKESFTQDEVNGMIAFYKTPAGQAVIKKMPVVMQKSMMTSQSMLQALIPKMQRVQQEFIDDLKAAEKK